MTLLIFIPCSPNLLRVACINRAAPVWGSALFDQLPARGVVSATYPFSEGGEGLRWHGETVGVAIVCAIFLIIIGKARV